MWNFIYNFVVEIKVNLMRRLFFLCFLAVFSLLALAQNVEQTLARFDQQADAATANAFFDALMKEKFIDAPHRVRILSACRLHATTGVLLGC